MDGEKIRLIKDDNLNLFKRYSAWETCDFIPNSFDTSFITRVNVKVVTFQIINNKFSEGEYRLAPLDGKLYAIKTTEEEVKPEPIKKYNIYGDEY